MAPVTRLLPLLVLATVLVWPASLAAQAPPLPVLTAPVNDFSRVIDPASSAELDRIIRALQSATGDALVVATVDTVGAYGSIEEYAVRLFEQAGIGTRASDNGVLMLVAVQDRKVRIEVGYGLEEFITDGFAGDTIRTRLLPAFREGRYGPGLVTAASVLATRIADGRGVALSDVQAPPQNLRGDDGPEFRIPGLFVLLIIFVVVNAIRNGAGRTPPFSPRGRRSTWSGWHGGMGGFGGGFGSGGGGGFGGGFGGFGGGRSGGGGASGGW